MRIKEIRRIEIKKLDIQYYDRQHNIIYERMR